jgi:diaminopimelate epimerase
MQIDFKKYQGTGNDFIMIDGRNQTIPLLNNEQITQLCDRRFGIGADGIIILHSHPKLDFEMVYFNPDGSQSFCGNGARCAVKFANVLNIIQEKAHFLAIDGEHKAELVNNQVAIKMNDIETINKSGNSYIIDTGSPHFITFASLAAYNIEEYGKEIRYSAPFKKDGINVNVVEELGDDSLQMMTYERGVEAETFSCGTGATAVAIAHAYKNKKTKINTEIQVKGGVLNVQAEMQNEHYKSIFLIGPAKEVFHGTVSI